MSLVLKIPRRLESPNKSRGAHWRVRHRITQEWEEAIWASGSGIGERMKRAAFRVGVGKTKVEIERHVKDGRGFIKDDDNLAFASKPILDALKRLGYIKDDSRDWLEHPLPTQHVSEDGKDWTVIRIEAVT